MDEREIRTAEKDTPDIDAPGEPEAGREGAENGLTAGGQSESETGREEAEKGPAAGGQRRDGEAAGGEAMDGFRLLSGEDRVETAKDPVLRIDGIRFQKGRFVLRVSGVSEDQDMGPAAGDDGTGETEGADASGTKGADISGTHWEGFLLSYDSKAEKDRSDYLIPARFHRAGRHISLRCSLDAANFPFRETHWTVFALCRRDGRLFRIPILKKKGGGSFAKLIALFQKNYMRRGKSLLFWRYKPGGKLGFALRERTKYDGVSTRGKEIVAAILYRIKKKSLRKKRILLIHEKKCFRAQDNGWYLFKHCMETDAPARLKREIFYVIDKKAPDYEKMSRWSDHVLDFMSLRHMICLLGCRAIASTESRMHDYLWLPTASLIASRVKKKKHIFLQHGVLALKRLPDLFLSKNMSSSLVACVSDREAGIVRDALGFSEAQAAITGYARFDALADQSEGRREILFMPTIRGNLFWAGESDFMADAYYKIYRSILQDPRLLKILETWDYDLNFFVHPSISRFAHLFEAADPAMDGEEENHSGHRIRLVRDSQTPMDTLMMRCAGLITDYSSIAWDVLYMKKPVIFFQYDLPFFLETSGSYLDLVHQSPGDRTETIGGLLDLIEAYAARDFEMPVRYSARLDAEYRYRDQKNAERIMNAIEERGL